MTATNNDTENNGNEYRSRYDPNRHCYRKDKTHYCYEVWVGSHTGVKGYYTTTTLTVTDEGINGITLELLDYLMATDNAEVQDQEDDKRLKGKLEESISGYSASVEEILFTGETQESWEDFNEMVRPHLSEDQVNLFYDCFGMGKTLKQIAEEMPVKKDGSHVTHQAVTNKLNRIMVEKATKAYGRPEITLHKLRHTCVSLLGEMGWNLKKIQYWCGHKDLSTTANIYMHFNRQQLNNSADDLARISEDCGDLFE